ncbi:MAG: hypothetical protein II873_06970 [Oscillospiraceae bacterium]|nr:hypothetical protein [Oscillospiraceae bacterium]
MLSQNRKTERTAYLLVCLLIECLCLWIAYSTPYGLDDWAWGLPYGWRMFLTGGLNSRYVGNLLEIIVTRSFFLKVVLHGTLGMLLPVASARVIERIAAGTEENSSYSLRLKLLSLAAFLFGSIPVVVWRETCGWVGGFSNYGLASFLLVCWQYLMFSTVRNKELKAGAGQLLLFGLFGVCLQLVLENVTIYALAATFLVLLTEWIRQKKCPTRLLTLFIGCAVGTALMFSSNIYTSLRNTGYAVGQFRSLSFSWDDSIVQILKTFYQRFVYFYPGNIWGNNWVVCCTICLLLLVSASRQKPFLRVLSCMFCLCFAAYFVFARFFGPIETYLSRWNEVLTQRLHLLFFCGVLLMLFLFRWKDGEARKTLIFLWISVPGVILPLIAVKMVTYRYFFCSDLFLIEFALALLAYEAASLRARLSRALTVILGVALVAVCVQRFVIYAQIGEGKRERDLLIQQARDGEITRLYFPELPHSEYLWTNEPPDGSEQVKFFRQYYGIPAGVEMSNLPFDGMDLET